MGQHAHTKPPEKYRAAIQYLRQEGAIAITGASSGIGAALARNCAAPGAVLYLNGRNHDRLEALAGTCRAQGAEVHTETADVRDRDAMARWIETIGHSGQRLGTLIANAGISPAMDEETDTRGLLEDDVTARAVFDTNLTGMLNTVLPGMALMRTQPPVAEQLRGRVSVIASLAGLAPIPYAPSYSASKAAAQSWAVAAAPRAWKEGIRLSAICPGFIRTPMTGKNRFRMPMLMEADDAAIRILSAIRRGSVRYAFPWPMAALAHLTALLPPGMVARMMPD